jgi:uncharacterized lipoprotein YmbA
MKVLALSLLVLATGCISLGGSSPEVHEYDLRPLLDATRSSAVLSSATIQVEPFGTDEALDRAGIVWRQGAEVGVYSAHRWTRPPQAAVREAVAASLRRVLQDATVATEPPLLSPGVVLRGHLTRCEEVDRAGVWYGALALEVVLERQDGVEIFRRSFSQEEPAVARNPLGVVEALERALARVTDALAREVASRPLEPREVVR